MNTCNQQYLDVQTLRLDWLQSGKMMVGDRCRCEMGCYIMCLMVYKIEQVEKTPFRVGISKNWFMPI